MGKADHDEIDGFRKWLGISSNKRPPTHYELLAVSLDEEDHEVIQAAAKQRKDFVKAQRGTGHDNHVTEILYLLAEAEITLLSPELRRDYDQKMNLFHKRKKRRQLDAHGNVIPPYRAASAGIETGFVEEYGKLVAILCVAFFGMAAASFLLPWQRVFNNDADQVVQDVPNAGGQNNAPPIARAPVPANQNEAAQIPEPQQDQDEDPPSEITNSIGMKLKLIPAGEFMMGSPDSDKDARSDEKPRHKVKITEPFYMGQYEVTKGQFAQFVQETGYETTTGKDDPGGVGWEESKGTFIRDPKYTWNNAGFDQTDDHPVVNVNWNDAVKFCEWLSKRENEQYQLPTEAQWEYACRAGTQTSWYFGDDLEQITTYGNVFDGTAREKIKDVTFDLNAKDSYIFSATVGQFKPNPFDLYDMHGNVWEWCQDIYDTNAYKNRTETIQDPLVNTGSQFRALRGGSYASSHSPLASRSASRIRLLPSERYTDSGFRVVRTKSTTFTNSILMKLKLIPAGEFMMGSQDADKGTNSNEKPRHKVRITKPFYMSQHEVTKGQFARFVQETNYVTFAEKNGVGGNGYNATADKFEAKKEFTWKNPGFEQTDDHPVLNVSWDDAVKFCEWLSERENENYQLPTEAQWEYACRAGSQDQWYFGNDVEGLAAVGNVKDASAKEKFKEWDTIKTRDGFVFTAPVGQFPPNAFGLYDMHGNAWEWCRDIFDENAYNNRSETTDDPFVTSGSDKRLMRGGSWYDGKNWSRSAHRVAWQPNVSFVNVGFRVVKAAK